MTGQPGDAPLAEIRRRWFGPIAEIRFALGVALLLQISRLSFLYQGANWDLLNYHACVPSLLLDGTWFSDFCPASIQAYLGSAAGEPPTGVRS